MKKLLTLLLATLFAGVGLQAQTRYIDQVFSDVTVNTNITYATNISVLSGVPTPQELKMDVYEPIGDTVSSRPLVLICGTGNFLPPIFNGGPFGTKSDSSQVEIATELARRGYVVASFSYRAGWNPLGDDDVRRSTLLQAAYRGIQDARTCIRFFRKNAAEDGNEYGIDPNKVVMGGTGTGGYVSLGSAFLDQPGEITLLKFINLNTSVPYVVPAIFGNYEGSDTTYLPAQDSQGNPIQILFNIGNHPGYSSEFDMAFHLGGALGDSSWIQDGDMPIVSFHVTTDAFAPYDVGNVIVPTTGDIVIQDAAGGFRVQALTNRFGNNDTFVSAGFSDPVTMAANMDNGGREGFFPFIVPPALPDTQCVTSIPGYPPSQGRPYSGPWNWYDEANFIGTWNFVGGQPGNPITGAEANCAERRSTENDPAKARTYIDTVMQYLSPRMALVLGLTSTTSLDNKALEENLRIYPNPASDFIHISNRNPQLGLQQVQLLDLTGRVVRNFVQPQTNELTVPTAELTAGLYLLRIRGERGQVTKKIVIE